jgi:N-dimethylarginine dimethylaminohydrolase
MSIQFIAREEGLHPGKFAWRRREFGVYSASGRLREVLLHRPGTEVDEVTQPALALWREFLDPVRARDEHDGLAEIYRSNDVRVQYLPEPPLDKPNLFYCCDLVAMCGERAILARPASPVRSGEERAAAKTLKALGIQSMSLADEKATFEGGDLVVVNDDLVLIGESTRTNRCGAIEVMRAFRAAGFPETHIIPVPPGHLHLDTFVNFASHNLAVVATIIETPSSLVSVLRRHGLRIANISDPYEAGPGMAVNFVPLEPDLVVLAAGNRHTSNLLKSFGVYCIEIDIGELAKGGGGLHCMTGILARSAV